MCEEGYLARVGWSVGDIALVELAETSRWFGTVKYLRWNKSAKFTSAIMTGTSTSGPITAANAAPELMPNTDTATAMANSKLFEAAVNDSVAVCA